ncbi:MAG: putative toxin-antitoxin system toxin component, PIN family [Blastochloris sp.]|nr:putative toxin-antitoxin system toxin component, PIN family [Blastochloris sp.]
MKHSPVWVFDTKVLVSGLLNPQGPPGRLLDALLRGDLLLAWDDRIMEEYREVLQRKKFGFHAGEVSALLDEFSFHQQVNPKPWQGMSLPDPSDLPFVEVAASLNDPVLVTGNGKHFPLDRSEGIRILSPQAAWHELVR